MLQCPNCKEYCITYFDTFGARLDASVCEKCDGLYKISTKDFLKRLFIPMLTIAITIIISLDIFHISPKYLIIIPTAIVFFFTDYYLYKNSAPLKKIKVDTKELGIINVSENEFIDFLEKLSKTKKKNAFITILEDEKLEHYLDISYEDNKYKLSLSLLSNNRKLESDFIYISENLGFLVNKDEMNKVQYLQITISENKIEAVEKLQEFITRIFNKKELKYFTILPDGI